MTSIAQILLLALDIAYFLVIAHLIMSWLLNFQVLNINQPLVAQIWHALQRILEPIYGPIRRMMPNLGGVDLTPLIAVFAIYALRILIINNLY